MKTLEAQMALVSYNEIKGLHINPVDIKPPKTKVISLPKEPVTVTTIEGEETIAVGPAIHNLRRTQIFPNGKIKKQIETSPIEEPIQINDSNTSSTTTQIQLTPQNTKMKKGTKRRGNWKLVIDKLSKKARDEDEQRRTVLRTNIKNFTNTELYNLSIGNSGSAVKVRYTLSFEKKKF